MLLWLPGPCHKANDINIVSKFSRKLGVWVWDVLDTLYTHMYEVYGAIGHEADQEPFV